MIKQPSKGADLYVSRDYSSERGDHERGGRALDNSKSKEEENNRRRKIKENLEF